MSSIPSYILGEDAVWKEFIAKTLSLIELWADLTFLYQDYFQPVHSLYWRLRKDQFPFPDRNYDDLRLCCVNVSKLGDSPILQ